MSLMNDALRSLDDSRKHNDVSRNDAYHIVHERLETPSEISCVSQAQNDVHNNEAAEQQYFYFLRVYYFFKLFFIFVCMFVFGYSIFLIAYKDKPPVDPVFNYVVSYHDVMKPFFYLNPLFESLKPIDKYTVIDSRINDGKINNEHINDDNNSHNELAEQMNRISILSDKGYAALSNNFLSTPKNNNAMFYFNQILAIDEGNVLALQGIDSVYRRYQHLITLNIERRHWSQAQTLVDRYVSIGGNQESIKIDKQRIARHKKNAYTPGLVTSDHLPSNSHLSVEKSRYYLEKEVFLRSQQWVKKNQISKAIDELNAVLDTQKYLTKLSAEFLFDLYLRIGDVDTARTVGQYVKAKDTTLLNNTSWDTVYENARIEQVMHGDFAALFMLRNTIIDSMGESSARLYAGLLQKNGDYALAQNMYRNLLRKYDKNATYWLGYSVSSDALGELDNALIGYRKTQNVGGLSSDVELYVANRLLVLQSDINSSSHVMESPW